MGTKLLRVDKNGTKYWVSDVCPRCNGSGKIAGFEHIYSGICFQCNGSGIYETGWKEYTPEYQQKLLAKRDARMAKQADEKNTEFLAKNGFDAEGNTWVITGNTFDIKEELKEAGAKYEPALGWHIDHETSYPSVKVNFEEITHKNDHNWLSFNLYKEVKAVIESKMPKVEKPVSGYVGEIGEKLETEVTYVKHYGYSIPAYNGFGEDYVSLFTFEDADGNVIVWKTTAYPEVSVGQKYILKGTVSDHREYKEVKQTFLKRCKLQEVA